MEGKHLPNLLSFQAMYVDTLCLMLVLLSGTLNIAAFAHLHVQRLILFVILLLSLYRMVLVW